MHLKIQQIVIFITFAIFQSCQDPPSSLTEVRGRQLPITDSLPTTDSVDAFIKPYRDRLNQVLDSPLAYAPYTITKTDGPYNTTAGNLMADIVLEEARPIFKSRTGKEIDFVVLNHGSIRSIISQGPVSARTAYEVMPFDNTIVVLELSGKAVRDLISFLILSDRPHPIAGLQIITGRMNSLQEVNINKIPFDENRVYYVATSDYLASGGDNMGFFGNAMAQTETNYFIRNAMIDYFKKIDTLWPKIDDRFVKNHSL